MTLPILSNSDEDAALGLSHRRILSSDRTAPLYLLVHGRAGDSSVMWLFKRSVPKGASVIAVQAPLDDPIGGFSWWEVKDGRNFDHSQALAATDRLEDFVRRAEEHFSLTPRYRVGMGFSQGGAVLSLAVQRDSIKFDAIALLASFVVPLEEEKGEIHRPEHTPKIFWGHGSEDNVVPIERAQSDVERLRQSGFSVSFHEDQVGHKIGTSAFKELTDFMSQFGG